jgi:hypothetical protein
MITGKMALKLGAKKLKEYLAKNNFTFHISISEINDWLEDQGHSDIKLKYNIESQGLELELEESKQ